MQGSNPVIDSLSVNGAINGQSINISGAASVGSLSVNGSATIDQNLSVGANLTVMGMTSVQDLSVGGHLLRSSNRPLVVAGLAIGMVSQVSISGTDTAGTLTITVETQPSAQQIASGMITQLLTAGDLVNVSFANQYQATPRVVISPDNASSVGLPVFVSNTDSGYSLISMVPLENGKTYQFDYIVVGSNANN